MSGPPTPERPTEPPQAAGRRRKRSDSPATGAPSPAGTPVVAGAIIVSESRAERHGEVAVTTGISRQPATWPTPYPDPQSYGFGAGATGLPGPAISSFEPQYGAGSSSPESKRRRKVHVPSACVNCKKKHLRCDNSRPCHRCIQTGQEDSCFDVRHKKRGRPPLKQDENAARRFADAEPGAEAGGLRGAMPGSSQPDAQLYPFPYERQSVAPRDTLQQPPGRQGELQRPPTSLAPSPYGLYAPPSGGSNYGRVSGTSSNPPAQHAPSSSSSLAPPRPPSPQYQTPSTGTGSEGARPSGRGYSGGYGHRPPRQELYPSSNSPYSASLFPPPSMMQQASFETAASAYTPQQSIAPELQLPPIRPAPPGGYTNPAMAQHQQRQAQHQQERDSRVPGRPGDNAMARQSESKRPRMSLGNIVNPRNDE